MTFHNALEPLPFRDADRIDVVALGKNRHANLVAGFHVHLVIAKFFDPLHCGHIALLDVTEQRLRQPMFLLLVETQLHRVVSVALDGLALDHMVRPRLHYSDMHQRPRFIIDPGLT